MNHLFDEGRINAIKLLKGDTYKHLDFAPEDFTGEGGIWLRSYAGIERTRVHAALRVLGIDRDVAFRRCFGETISGHPEVLKRTADCYETSKWFGNMVREVMRLVRDKFLQAAWSNHDKIMADKFGIDQLLASLNKEVAAVEKSPEYIGPTDYEVLLRNDVDSLDRLGDEAAHHQQLHRQQASHRQRMAAGLFDQPHRLFRRLAVAAVLQRDRPAALRAQHRRGATDTPAPAGNDDGLGHAGLLMCSCVRNCAEIPKF